MKCVASICQGTFYRINILGSISSEPIQRLIVRIRSTANIFRLASARVQKSTVSSYFLWLTLKHYTSRVIAILILYRQNIDWYENIKWEMIRETCLNW